MMKILATRMANHPLYSTYPQPIIIMTTPTTKALPPKYYPGKDSNADHSGVV